MNLFFGFIASTLSFASGTSPIRIPFLIDSFENLLASGNVVGRDSPLRILLKPRGQSGFFHVNFPRFFIHTTDSNNPLFVTHSLRDCEGSSSDFIFGDVTVIKNPTNNSGHVILNSTQDEFVNSCSTGSILRTRFDRLVRSNKKFLTVKIFLPDVTPDNIWESAVVTFLGPQFILEAPEIVFDEITIRLIGGNCRPVPNHPHIFRECPDSIFESLPTIQFQIDEYGHLDLIPQDYLLRDNDRFILRLTRATAETNNLKFNPFALPFTNIRLNSEYIELCDSSL